MQLDKQPLSQGHVGRLPRQGRSTSKTTFNPKYFRIPAMTQASKPQHVHSCNDDELKEDLKEKLTNIRSHGFIHWAPPDFVLGARFPHDALVQWRTPSFRPRERSQGASRGYCGSCLIDQCVFVQSCNRRIGDLCNRR